MDFQPQRWYSPPRKIRKHTGAVARYGWCHGRHQKHGWGPERPVGGIIWGIRSWGEPGVRGWLVFFFAAYIIIYFIPCFKVWGESTKTCTCIHSSFVECFSLNKDVVVLVGSYFTCCWVTVFFSITCFFPRHPEFMAVSLFALHVP